MMRMRGEKGKSTGRMVFSLLILSFLLGDCVIFVRRKYNYDFVGI